MPSIDLPHGRINYRVAGPDDGGAPPVVFVHGLLVDGELWTQTADLLAEAGVRSYAPTLPLGAHRTPMHDGADLSPQGQARLIHDFLTALDLHDVTLVGNDTGGALCQFAIDAGHERIGRLLLTNCDGFEKFPPPPFGVLIAAARRPGRVKALAAPMRLKAVRHSLLGFGGLSTNLDADLTRRWIEPALTEPGVRHDLAAFARAVRPADLMDVSTRLGRFDKPVRLVWGTSDLFFKLSLGVRLRDAFPAASLVEVDGARTFVALDAPHRLADEIAAFARASGPSARNAPG